MPLFLLQGNVRPRFKRNLLTTKGTVCNTAVEVTVKGREAKPIHLERTMLVLI